MKSLFRVIRYSSVGIFLAGIFTTIVGCSNEDQLRALILFILLLLSGGGGSGEEETSSLVSFTFSAGPALSFNQAFGENTTACTDGGADNFHPANVTLVDIDTASVNVTINAFRYCRTLAATDEMQVIVVEGTPPNLTLKARTETMTVTDADCTARVMCIVHFEPGIAVSATNFVGFYVPLPAGQMGSRSQPTGSAARRTLLSDPAGTNAYGTGNVRHMWDFGTQ